ncbi:hypothetical protein ENSA5_06490 [Enhygromyxa salina]|uniref:Uncharacterized protein n=1 Tax=Enhygromyxa salina TaxID=215803 RepID=A0A2S9YHR1_9BACT|nr:hypothetical protein [Enhygromyxa salina]PRQ04644.1 hypothetical protein ENSA5_06490 [Enhygromyxa salina]
MADVIGPGGTFKVKIKDTGNNTVYLKVDASGNLATDTDCDNGQGFGQTCGGDGRFTLSFNDGGTTKYIFASRTSSSITLSTSSADWETSGDKMQLPNNADKQLKIDLTLGSSGDTVSLLSACPP